MTYAIVKLGGKQYRVHEGEKLLVDRLALDENKTFHPEVLFVGGDGDAELAPNGVQVTAKLVGHVLGDKIVIGKHRQRTGYRRRNGFRAKLSQVQIETIGKKATRTAAAPKAEAEEQPDAKAAPKPKPTAAAKPKATATAARPRTTTKKQTTEKVE
jgi:large subunit ribosomal protein L21